MIQKFIYVHFMFSRIGKKSVKKEYWKMQQVFYLSVDYKKTEEHFIERAKNAMNKIFEEYNVHAIKEYFKEHYAKIYGKSL